MAFGFIEADLVAFGSLNTVKASIDAHATNRNIVSNNDMMKLVNEIDNANAWAVGRFDAIASKAGIPTEIAAQMPSISWFSAAGHINGGVSGTVQGRNEGRSDRQEPARHDERLPGDGEDAGRQQARHAAAGRLAGAFG